VPKPGHQQAGRLLHVEGSLLSDPERDTDATQTVPGEKLSGGLGEIILRSLGDTRRKVGDRVVGPGRVPLLLATQLATKRGVPVDERCAIKDYGEEKRFMLANKNEI
jgi:hypothetical protein